MKSLNSQDQWTWKFALKFFLALLLNNFLLISESFVPSKIAKAESKPQPTITYPYKLLPNQPPTDCAIGDDTDFPYDDEGQTLVTEILQWSPVEREAWLKICQGKPFDTVDSLSHLDSKVSDWINKYDKWISDNNLKKEEDSECNKFNLNSDENSKNIKFSEISKILDKKPLMVECAKSLKESLEQLETNQDNNVEKNRLEKDLFEFYNQLKIVIWISNFVERFNRYFNRLFVFSQSNS